MDAILDDQSIVLADDRAEEVWRDIHANPGHMEALMQQRWDESLKGRAGL